MDEVRSYLSDKTKSKLYEINKMKDYFNSEIEERKIMTKKISKNIPAFDYNDRILTVLSAASGRVSFISFAVGRGLPVGIASARFTLVLSLTTGKILQILRITRNKMKKQKDSYGC